MRRRGPVRHVGARHAVSGLLELRSVHDGKVYAEWHQVQNSEPSPPNSIPAGFTWEKNDDDYRGYVDPADLTDITDTRHPGR